MGEAVCEMNETFQMSKKVCEMGKMTGEMGRQFMKWERWLATCDTVG